VAYVSDIKDIETYSLQWHVAPFLIILDADLQQV
jgi:hypothetical protein